MTAKRDRARKKGDDSAAYLRAPKPLKAAPGLALSRESKRKALRAGACALAAGAAWAAVQGVLLQSAPFRLDPEGSALRIRGLEVIAEEEVAGLFAADLGRSLAAVDTSARLEQLLAVQWVRTARVGRVWPNAVAVAVEERQPVAFLRLEPTNAVRMIDATGAILDLRGGAARSLPVLTGIAADMPPAARLRRVRLFEAVAEVFRRRGAAVGRSLSEVDVADETNAVVLAKHRDQMIRLQMGDRHLRHRLDVFLNYVEAWKAEFGPLEAVDLRFEKQVALRPAGRAKERG